MIAYFFPCIIMNSSFSISLRRACISSVSLSIDLFSSACDVVSVAIASAFRTAWEVFSKSYLFLIASMALLDFSSKRNVNPFIQIVSDKSVKKIIAITCISGSIKLQCNLIEPYHKEVRYGA